MADTQFELESDSPAKSDMMFWQLAGVESFSRPSRFMLTVLSRNRQIKPDDVLGKSFTVKLEFHDEGGGAHKRQYQGYAMRMRRVGDANDRLCMYHIELDSWFSLLQHRSNARIFQEKKFDEVIKDVMQDSNIRTVENIDYAGLRETHAQRRYCVQYLESDFDFLSRLMEHEGVYYWFDNAGSGDGKKMMLADNVSVHEKLPVESTLNYAAESTSGESRFNEVEAWWSERAVQTGRMEVVDHDFKKIRSKLGHKVDFAAQHDHADYEVFEFPGGFFDKDGAQRTGGLRAEERIARSEACWAATRWPDVAVGRVFQLSGHTEDAMNQEWLIGRCLLVLSHPGYEGITVDARAHEVLTAQFFARAMAPLGVWAGIDRQLDMYTRARVSHAYLLEVAPANTTYRPPRLTPRLQMSSPHTAIVVGPAGEEIHMDEFGRVKVQFHWDRYGKSDEKSTAWIRVSQPWAGQSWGGQFIPRIGQEVIVDFLYGDPDRPIIVGRVYNDDQPIPYQSPTQSGFKTRSTPGGGPANHNEIMFEDKKGDELLKFHAEKNMATTVENDDSTTVDRDQSVTVKRDQTLHVDRDRKSTVTRNDTNMVAVDQKNTVQGKQNNQVVGNRETFVDGKDVFAVGGTSTVDVTGARTTTFRAGEDHTVVGNQSVTVTGKVTYKAASMSFEAAHIDWMVTGASSKYITVPTGPLHLMANKIKLMSNAGIEMMTAANIDATSVGSNTTVLGPNTSGYIGFNSEATLGLSTSTFMGLSIENALAVSISNFVGAAIDNALGVKLCNGLAPEISSYPISVDQQAMKTFTPGAGAGGAGGAAVAGVLGAVAGVASAVKGVGDTLKQYADAATALDEAAAEAQAAHLPGLADRLSSLASITRNRRIEGIIGAVPVIGTAAMALAEGLMAEEGIKTGGERLAESASSVNADGTPIPPPPAPAPAPWWSPPPPPPAPEPGSEWHPSS